MHGVGDARKAVRFWLADYDSTAPRAAGGGHEHEGEDIAVLQVPLDDALAMIADGRIIDAKTILLLQAAKLSQL